VHCKLQITTVSYRQCVRAGCEYLTKRLEGSSFVPLVDEYELASEFDDLRGVVLRESSDELDDSTDSEHSSDDDTASADSDGGSDSDESDGA